MKQFESFTLDTANECLWHNGARIALAPKPFAVLRYLVENAGRLVSHDELLDALWPDIYVQPQVLRTYMLELRKVLADDPRTPRFIRSIPKRGYCFVADVSEGPSQPASTRLIAQPASPARSSGPLVARQRELESLSAAINRAVEGSRQVVFLTGEAGVGKSALLQAVRRQLETGFAVAFGQCVPGFAARQEYYALADALRQLRDTLPATSESLRLDLGAAPGIAPAELCAAIENTGREKPLAVLLEDLQWADRSTIDVISALARRDGHARLLIVATVAPQSGAAHDEVRDLMHDLRIRRLGTEIIVPRLNKAEIADFLRIRLQQQCLPDGLHAYLFENSEGNPRYALAILDHLVAEGLLRKSGSPPQWELAGTPGDLDEAAPLELARTIEFEIARLSDREQSVLEAASIPPVAFPAWAVAAALDEDLATTEEICDSIARRSSLIRRAGEEELPGGMRSAFYVFTHAMYREVLYRRQSPARRASRHVRIARRLRDMFRGREELIAPDAASHYEAAHEWKEAFAMLRLAARRAIELRAWGEVAEIEARIASIAASLPAPESQAGALNRLDTVHWSAEDGDHPHTASTKA